jgi:hypothetical protein
VFVDNVPTTAPVVVEDTPPLGDTDDDAGPVLLPAVGVPVDAAPAPAADEDVEGCGGRKACGGMGGGLICVSTTGGRAA